MQHFARIRGNIKLSIALVAVLTLTLSSGLLALANVTVVQVSMDPYTNTSSMHATEVEPDTFSYGNTVVGTSQVGRFYDGGSSNIGWETSTDNGATWTHGFLPGTTTYATPPGPYARISDPSVAYDASHGVWMIVALPLQGAGGGLNTSVSRSTNGGLAWLNPVTVVTQGGLDKTWIACDNSPSSAYYGNCYVEYDNNGGGNIMQMVTSSDGGLTWGPVRTPSGSPSGLGGQPVVQANGTVVVPYSENGGAIGAFRSTNGGTSWTSTVTVSSVSEHGEGGNIRTSALPSAEVDSGGRVFVVWQDCRFRSGCSSNDIVMSSSTDGVTWSAVTRIPIDPVSSTVDHFIPGIAVDKSRSNPVAHLALTYYYYPVANCTVSSCQLNVGFVSSTDGGASWTTPTAVAGPMTMNWLALTNQGYMVGDYISTSFDPLGKAHPVFAIAHAPSGGVFDEAMYSPMPGLSLGSMSVGDGKVKTVPAGGDKVVFTGWGDRPLPSGLPTSH